VIFIRVECYHTRPLPRGTILAPLLNVFLMPVLYLLLGRRETAA